MSRFRGELAARAGGLSSRLLDRPTLERLAELGETARLAHELEARDQGEGEPAGAITPTRLDRRVARTAARRLGLLERRVPAGATVTVLFELEEVESLRALLRGAAADAPPRERLAAVVPSRRLPPATLESLAVAEDVPSLVAGLERAGHPLGRALSRATAAPAAGLAALEVAMLGACLARANGGGRDRHLRRHLALTADLANGWSVLAGGRTGGEGPAPPFLEGGERLDRDTFLRLHRREDVRERREALGDLLGRGGLGAPMADPTVPVGELEGRILGLRILSARRAVRVDPLSTAPLLLFLLAQRAELRDLRRVVWGTAAGAPPSLLRRGLSTPAVGDRQGSGPGP